MLIEFEDRSEQGAEMALAYLEGRDPWAGCRRNSGDVFLWIAAGVQLAVSVLSIVHQIV